MGAQGSMGGGVSAGFGGNIQQVGPWWTAFGTGGLEGEPPLLEGACHSYVFFKFIAKESFLRFQSSELTFRTFGRNQ